MLKKLFTCCLILIGVFVVHLVSLSPIFAQDSGVEPGETFETNPKDRSTTVTATVLDNTPPTTPILIAPDNNSYATVNKPDFIWEASSDANGISHYQFFLDGSQLFGDLPTYSTETSQYLLVYNATTDRYTLTPKAGLAEGTHTWKIRVFDTLDQNTDSATWTFTIDTAAPSFVITHIGDQNTSISAQDSSTVPSEPIELTENQPLLSGTGEANSTVSLTVTIPGDPTQHVTFPIAANGTWQHQLGILPRDITITLDFVITDQAGNVSVLSGVQIVIKKEVIVYPPASDAAGSPTVTPSSSITPSPAASPIISIPVIPPTEVIHEVIQEVTERIPSPIVALVEQLPEEVQQTVIQTTQTIAPAAALIANTAIPAFTTLAVASQLGGGFSASMILTALQAIGLLPKKKPQGLVYNSQTGEPVPFVRLTIKAANLTPEQNETADSILETVITDTHGIYQGVSLPNGKYQMTAAHQEYFFPTSQNRPPLMSFQEFYKGEVFDISSQQDAPLFLIPVDPKQASDLPSGVWKRMQLKLAKVRLRDLTVPLFSFSVLVTAFFPTFINFFILGIYGLIFTRQAIQSLRVPHIGGKVVDEQGNPLGRGIVRVSHAENNQLVAITTTDDNGEFEVFVKPDIYQISVTHYGYARIVEGAQLSFEAIDTRQESVYLVIPMTNVSEMYKELGIG